MGLIRRLQRLCNEEGDRLASPFTLDFGLRQSRSRSTMLHMLPQLRTVLIVSFILGALSFGRIAVSQLPRKFTLSQFDDIRCRSKGRLQDCSTGNPITTQILAGGKLSIPVLISQLTETTRTKEPVVDFWAYTTSGDIAFMFLSDLFTDADDESFTMPGVPNWKTIMSGCDGAAEVCWRKYVGKRGIASVQQSWQTAWETNRNRIMWDSGSRCFRLRE